MERNIEKENDIYDKEAFFIIEADRDLYNREDIIKNKIEDDLRNSLRVFTFYGGGLNSNAKYQFGVYFDKEEWDFENSDSYYGKKGLIIKKRIE